MRSIKNVLKDFWKDRTSNWLLGVGLGVYCLVAIGIWRLTGWPMYQAVTGQAWSSGLMPPEFPLFYSLPKGTEQLAVIQDLWNGLAWLGLLLVINMLLSILLHKKYVLLSYLVLWAAIFSVGMWGFTVLRIYLLVV